MLSDVATVAALRAEIARLQQELQWRPAQSGERRALAPINDTHPSLVQLSEEHGVAEGAAGGETPAPAGQGSGGHADENSGEHAQQAAAGGEGQAEGSSEGHGDGHNEAAGETPGHDRESHAHEVEDGILIEDDEVTPVTSTIAAFIFGIMIFEMILLYLVNHRDPDIRSAIYKMISTTISIFCAVLTNQAIHSFIFEQIIPSPFPRGLGLGHEFARKIEVKFFVGAASLLLSFIALNWAMLVLGQKGNENHIFAAQVLFGHITAFACILAFGSIQQARQIKGSLVRVVIVAVVAWIMMLVVRKLTALARAERIASGQFYTQMPSCFDEARESGSYSNAPQSSESRQLQCPDCQKPLCLVRQGNTLRLSTLDAARESSHRGSPINSQPSSKDLAHKWMEQVIESEDEATALALSFLAYQCIALWATGALLPLEGDPVHHTPSHIKRLTLASSALLLLTVGVTIVRVRFENAREEEPVNEPGNRNPSDGPIQTEMPASGGAGCIQQQARARGTSSGWLVRGLRLTQSFLPMTMGWCLFKIGDWLLRMLWNNHHMTKVCNAAVMTLVAIVVIFALDKCADKVKEFTADSTVVGDNLVTIDTEIIVLGKEGTAKSLRVLIGAAGVLVGICWEKAVDASDETLVKGIELFRHHPVIGKAVIASCVVLCVVPAWLWYVVPRARMEADVMGRFIIEERRFLKKDFKRGLTSSLTNMLANP